MGLIDGLKKVFGSSGGNTDQDKAPSDSATLPTSFYQANWPNPIGWQGGL